MIFDLTRGSGFVPLDEGGVDRLNLTGELFMRLRCEGGGFWEESVVICNICGYRVFDAAAWFGALRGAR